MRKLIKNSIALLVCAGFVAACIALLASTGEPVTAALYESALSLWSKQ